MDFGPFVTVPMKTIRRFKQAALIAFFLLIMPAGLGLAAAAPALGPEDLIVVFNHNVPESREVAAYYAQKRRVPRGNLLGVKVSAGESMSRGEYDRELAPEVRRQAAAMRLAGRKPAVLLVYGIPLRVGAAELTRAEQELQRLAGEQAGASAARAWASLTELEGLLIRVPGQPPAAPDRPSSKEVFSLAARVLPRAQEVLGRSADSKIAPASRTRMAALAAELTGRAPGGQAEAGKKPQGEAERDEGPLPEGHAAPGDHRLQTGAGLAAQARQWGAQVRNSQGLLGEMKFWEHLQRLYGRPQTGAAVDSELSLMLVENYPKVHWLPNPLNLHFEKEPAMQRFRQAVVMVGRLDGPTPRIARRLVDDALKTEARGLEGVCYLDARGLKGERAPGSYAWFDRRLERLADLMKERSTLKVVLDRRPGLFLPGSCPRAALYCGWYSLAKYAASCSWEPGAVAYHVASAEATTLRSPGSQVWCKRMLEEGVAATLGPVAEPYLSAFPLPDEFFPLLLKGELSLLEVYYRTVPHLSWQMVLIGDPLYRPFKKNPAWRE